MELTFFTPSRMQVLKEISKQPASASAIAKATNVSLPYVLNQIKLLEAKEIIKQTTSTEQKVGKPAKKYEIAKPIIQLIHITNTTCKQTNLATSTPLTQLYLQVLTTIPNHHDILSTYFWTKKDLLEKLEGFALLKTTEKTIELIAITTPEQLEFYRKEISSFHQNSQEVNCWVHTSNEIKEGKERNDQYYVDLLKSYTILFQKERVFEELER